MGKSNGQGQAAPMDAPKHHLASRPRWTQNLHLGASWASSWHPSWSPGRRKGWWGAARHAGPCGLERALCSALIMQG